MLFMVTCPWQQCSQETHGPRYVTFFRKRAELFMGIKGVLRYKRLLHISPINEFAVPDCICKSSMMLGTCLYQLHMMLFLSKRYEISSTCTITWKIPLISFCITSSFKYQYLSYPVPWHLWKYCKQNITYADNITSDDIEQDLICYHDDHIKIWFDFG